MSKVTSFILGSIVGAAAALVATSLLAPDTVEELTSNIKSKSNELKDKAADLKDKAEDKVSDNDVLDNLKTKFDNSTDLIKSQLQSLPKQAVNDDSELTDFDDIVIDDTEAFGKNEAKNDEVLDDLIDGEDEK